MSDSNDMEIDHDDNGRYYRHKDGLTSDEEENSELVDKDVGSLKNVEKYADVVLKKENDNIKLLKESSLSKCESPSDDIIKLLKESTLSKCKSPFKKISDDGGKENNNEESTKESTKESSFSNEDRSLRNPYKKSRELLSGLDETKGRSKCSFRNIFGYFFLLLILGVLLYVTRPYLVPSSPNHNYNDPDEFVTNLRAVKKIFSNQNDLIWNMIKNGGRRHLMKIRNSGEEKLTPQSYLIAGYLGSSSIVESFALKIAKAFTKLQPKDPNDRLMDAKEFSNDTDAANLCKELKSRLNRTEKLLIIKNIDSLPYNVAYLFMSYADEYNEVASYPQSLLLLTTELPFAFDPVRSRHDDERLAAQHFKDKVWGDVPRYKVDPLWSRVGDGLVLIKKEEINPSMVKEDL